MSKWYLREKWLAVCSLLVVLVATSASPPRIYLSFFDNEAAPIAERGCLVRDSGFSLQGVRITPCALISPSNLLSAAWVWFPDGRLRGTNSFCLKYRPNPSLSTALVAAECSQRNASLEEIWTIRNGKLWSESMLADSNSSDGVGTPAWQRENVHVEKFNETSLLSLQRESLKTAVASRLHRFRQMSKDVPGVARGK